MVWPLKRGLYWGCALVAAGSLTGCSTMLSTGLVGSAVADDARAHQRDHPPENPNAHPPPSSDALSRRDPDLTDTSIDCDRWSLGEDQWATIVTAHYVVDGQLGSTCLGTENAVLASAWNNLVTITPPDQLNDLGLFVGFVPPPAADDKLLAWTNTIFIDGSSFQLAINLDEASADPDELLLTLAHEFSHVFTNAREQVDRTLEGERNCATYYDGEGCFAEDSLLWRWIEEFWDDGLIDDIDPERAPIPSDGEDRCAQYPGFFGPYAASDPQEDFAEAFSAYVFALKPHSAEQQRRLDWLDAQPGLAEFRQRAVEAGLAPLPNTFKRCGP